MAGLELEPEEVLERAGQPRAPFVGRHAGQLDAVDQDPARVRLVELGQEFDERRLAGAVLADDGDDRAGRQFEIYVVQHEPIGSGIGERDMLEADALREARGHGPVGRGDERGGVVLQPGEAAGTVHPDAAQETDLADRRADVGGQSRAGGQHEQDVARPST